MGFTHTDKLCELHCRAQSCAARKAAAAGKWEELLPTAPLCWGEPHWPQRGSAGQARGWGLSTGDPIPDPSWATKGPGLVYYSPTASPWKRPSSRGRMPAASRYPRLLVVVATHLLGHIHSKVLLSPRLPVMARTSTRVQPTQRHQALPCRSLSLPRACGMGLDHQGCAGACLSAMSPRCQAGDPAELPVPHRSFCLVAFAPLMLLRCLGNDGIRCRSDLTGRQMSHRERDGVRDMAVGISEAPRSGHQTGARGCPQLPYPSSHPVKDGHGVGAGKCPVPACPTWRDSVPCPSVPGWSQEHHCSWSDGNELPWPRCAWTQ